jgi:hypothetical protein
MPNVPRVRDEGLEAQPARYLDWGRLTALALALLACSCAGGPPPPPRLEPVDPNSEAFQKEMADELAAGRREAQTRPAVTRRFVVTWEMHYGYRLIPPGDLDTLVVPDFPDEAVAGQFQAAESAAISHLGGRLICECVGVEWSLYEQPRFIVREARLSWER